MDVTYPRGWDRSSSGVGKQGEVEPVKMTAVGWVPMIVGAKLYYDMAPV